MFENKIKYNKTQKSAKIILKNCTNGGCYQAYANNVYCPSQFVLNFSFSSLLYLNLFSPMYF